MGQLGVGGGKRLIHDRHQVGQGQTVFMHRHAHRYRQIFGPDDQPHHARMGHGDLIDGGQALRVFNHGHDARVALRQAALEFEFAQDFGVMAERQTALLKTLETHWRLSERKSEAEAADGLLAALSQGEVQPVFEMTSLRHGLKALARENDKVFTVLAGSMAKQSWTGVQDPYEQLRLKVIAEGGLVPSDQGPWMVFARDVDFTSPSAASATILGRADNGRTTWRLKGTSIVYGA